MDGIEEETGCGNEETIKSRRKVLKLAGSTAGAGVATGVFGHVRAAARTPPLTIIHGTQFEGRFGKRTGPNISRYTTAVNKFRQKYPNTVFIGTGDDLAKAPLATPFGGTHIVEALNHLQLTTATIGNHDFDYGPSVLTKQISRSSFPWLSTNLRTTNGNPIPGSKRWVTKSINGTRVGIFGLAPQNTAELEPTFPKNYRVINNVPAARTAVANLKAAGVDYIICGSHLALTGSKTVAKRVDGIDAIVGDHIEHVFDKPQVIDGTVINTVGAGFHHIGAITLTENGLDGWEQRRITRDVKPDPGMQSLTHKWRRTITLGGTAVTLPP
ncbi:bifunctional metallophosphatase/5'-nucleotidase [Haladaptatus sp. DFWS20]|uniref:bifunctional metallophosphatase/5'-nucleotidase n=1 Tax=Haladaptatus sp. DFWS20 TaxID=3403467 RepID=UPI003EC1059E